jgi:hypothetical protein
MEVTLNLPEKIYIDLSKSAEKSKRSFDEEVSERLEKSENPLRTNSDEEVLEAANLWIPESQSKRQSELLYKQQADDLNEIEAKELKFFQEIYRIALLKKAQGINEAMRRGLIQTVDELQ